MPLKYNSLTLKSRKLIARIHTLFVFFWFKIIWVKFCVSVSSKLDHLTVLQQCIAQLLSSHLEQPDVVPLTIELVSYRLARLFCILRSCNVMYFVSECRVTSFCLSGCWVLSCSCMWQVDEAIKRLHVNDINLRTSVLPPVITASEGAMKLVKHLGFHFQVKAVCFN